MKQIKMNRGSFKKAMRSAAVCCAVAAVGITPASAFASSGAPSANGGAGGVYGSLDRQHWYSICSTYHNWYPETDRPTHPSAGGGSGLVHRPFDGNSCPWNWGGSGGNFGGSENGGSSNNNGQTSAAPSGYASEVFDLVNQQRSANGQSALAYSAEAAKVAQAKAEDMAANKYFSHTSPTYGSAFDMLKANGVSYKSAGENIAKGQTSASSVMKAWMNSSGHRANILSSSYKSVGVGCAADSSGTLYWVQVFIG